jgi:hypothetical protein
MDIKPAILIREVSPMESLPEVVNEAKALTWTHRAEHALIRCAPGNLFLVRGGADGIGFQTRDGRVYIDVDGVAREVTLLAWHTHPRPTGPSDHDRNFLKLLGQHDSLIYEMFSDGNGTRFRPKDPETKP